MRRLPPLGALRVFEVAARTGSYTAAGLELGLTHGAVSRQIAVLEAWLGRRLFAKQGRRMVATPMAGVLAAEAAAAFDRLAGAADACGRPEVRRILRVSAPTSFAMRWLIPRLDRYHAAQPDTEIVVTTVSTVFEALRGGVDVSVRSGAGGDADWSGYRAVPVLENHDTLVMSPALFARRPVRVAADVEGHVLLGSETRAGDWTDWLDRAGLSGLAGHPRRVFDHFFVTRQAVEDGLGLGIGPLPLLSLDLDRGRLVAPLPEIRVRRPGYVALLPRRAGPGDPATRFVDWLAGEATVSAA